MYGALYGQHPMIQGIALLQDLKLGQYVKLAPRVTFLMQMMGELLPFEQRDLTLTSTRQVPLSAPS